MLFGLSGSPTVNIFLNAEESVGNGSESSRKLLEMVIVTHTAGCPNARSPSNQD